MPDREPGAADADLSGKIVLVTGGARGVGRAIARRFARLGAHVVINYFHSQDQAAAGLAEIRAAGGSAETLRASVARRSGVETMFAEIHRRHGGLDVLVNNAAHGVIAPLGSLTDRDWERIFATNVYGALWCCRSAAELMTPRGGGSIVNLSSVGARITVADYAAVGVSKAALEALTRYLAVEYAPLKIRVNTASSGLVDNRTAELWPASAREVTMNAAPLGGLAAEEDLAGVVTYLAGPGARWITGQTILADGGLTLGAAMVSPPKTPGTPEPAKPSATEPTEASTPEPTETLTAEPAETSATAGGGKAAPSEAYAPAGEPGTEPSTPLVAVVGMGVVLPGADDPTRLWERLLRPEPMFSEPGERFDLERFWSPDPDAQDRTYARLNGYIHGTAAAPSGGTAGEPDSSSGYAHLWLETALRQALATPVQREGDRYGCYIGQWVMSGQQLEESLAAHAISQALQEAGPEGLDRADDERARKVVRDWLPYARRLSRAMLPDGIARTAAEAALPPGAEVISLDTACSSSLYAIDLGVRKLLAGERDIVLCGGVEELQALDSVLFSRLGGLSPGGDVRPFDEAADGTLFTDAAGVVALKTLDRARADGDRVLGVLAGFGAASDGRGKAIYAPNSTGQIRAMERARAVSGLKPADIDWIIAHATGTVAGDGTELTGIRETMREHPVVVTSNKSLVGHSGWAAGAVSVIHALLAIEHGRIPAQQRFRRLPESADPGAAVIADRHRDWPATSHAPRTVGISGFGFGGTNAHLIVRDRAVAGDRSAPPVVNDPMVLVAWTALLPGDPGKDQVRRWLREGFPAGLGFGPDYPAPSFSDIRLPPKTVAGTDRTQLMAVQLVARFLGEPGAAWANHGARTGVFSGYFEPPRLLADAVARAYRETYASIARCLADQEGLGAAATAVRGLADRIGARVAPLNEDVLPGLMPNIVAGRVANRFDLHGPSIAVDTGRDSVLCAVNVAEHYLLGGEIDLALVLGVSGNATPWAAEISQTRPGDIAEGAFLLALTRFSVAGENGWPLLATLRTAGSVSPPGGAISVSGTGNDTTFLSADGAVAILRALEQPGHRMLVTGVEPDLGGCVRVTVPAATKRIVMTERAEPGVLTGEVLAAIPPHSAILTDDASIAAALVEYARARECVVVCAGPCDLDGVRVLPEITETSLDAVAREAGAIRHLRVITPIHAGTRAWPARPDAGLTRLHEAFFLAAKTWHAGLRRNGSICCLLLDALGDDAPHPHAALLTGTMRALSREMPDIEVYAVLTDDADLGAGLAQVRAESGRARHLPAIHYRHGVRHVQHAAIESLDARSTSLIVDDTSVVVAAGGARGITATCLRALAERVRPRLWILGTAELEPASSSPVGDEEFLASRKDFIRRRLAEHGGTPARHNAEFERRLRAREASGTVRALRARLGEDRVGYLACDVTDAGQVRAAAERILAADGRVDLMLFAAGITRSAAVESKTLADFRRVLATKVAGYHHVRDAFAGSVTTWCSFGSLSATLGLPGETDYVPGNDYLHSAAANSANEFAIGWPAWSDTGILASTPLVQAAAARRQENTGLDPREGAAHFLGELAADRPATAVSYYCGGKELAFYLRRTVQPAPTQAARYDPRSRRLDVRQDAAPPFHLDTCLELSPSSGAWRRTLDLERDRYLVHHEVRGKPTVPAMVELEMAAEAATALVPGTRVHAFSDARFLSFLQVLPGRPGPRCHITARVLRKDHQSVHVHVKIMSDFVHANGTVLRSGREHAHVTVELVPAAHPPIPPLEPRRPDRAGTVTPDPYTLGTSPVRLSGPFAALTGCHVADRGGGAALDLPLKPDDPIFRTFLIPAVSLDALARTAILTGSGPRPSPVAVPTAIDRIWLYTTGNDCELAANQHIPLTLYARPDAPGAVTECSAVTPDDEILLRIRGITTVPMGS